MSRRSARLLSALLLVSALGACASASSLPGAPTPPAAVVPPTSAPVATPVPAAPSSPSVAASPDSGNVDGPGNPDFSVEPVGNDTVRATLSAPDAKAWRILVAGTGDKARNAWELTLATGDVAPAVTTTDTINGKAGAPVEQPKLEMGTATGRVCSKAVPLCVVASSVELPADGNATLVLELVRTDPSAPLSVVASTATWDGEPFVLGPWTSSEPFDW